MDEQYVITGALIAVFLVLMLFRREHVWRRSPRRFWLVPIGGVVAILVAVPASELEHPGDVGLMILGAVVGLTSGAFRGTARFTNVGADPDGKIAYRPNIIGFVALIVIFALHYLANFAANDDSDLQFILAILLTFGVGETLGWHSMVFWRWRELTRDGTPPSSDHPFPSD